MIPYFRGCLPGLLVAAGLGVVAPPASAQSPDTTPLTLPDAIETALAYHPAIGAARASQVAAASRVGEATALWWPSLNAAGSLMQNEEPMLVYPLHGLPAGPPDTSIFRFDRTLLQGNVSLAWTLWDGGARSARVRSARADEAAVVANGDGTAMTVIGEVAAAYLTVLSSAATRDAHLQSLQALAAERDRVQRLLAEGRAARVELLRVDAAIAQAEAEHIGSTSRLEAAEHSLARLLGVEPARTRSSLLEPVRLVDSTVTENQGRLVAQFEAASPEVAEASARAEAASLARRVAAAAWHPKIDLVGAYLAFGSTDADVRGEWQTGVRLSYPLFTGFARSRAVGGASARAAAAQEQLRLIRLHGEETIDRALTGVRESHARAAALATAVQHLEEVARIERLTLEAGAGTQTDFLRADADLRSARASLVDARHTEILARIQLARATGTLTVEWLANTLETLP